MGLSDSLSVCCEVVFSLARLAALIDSRYNTGVSDGRGSLVWSWSLIARNYHKGSRGVVARKKAYLIETAQAFGLDDGNIGQ